MDITYEYEVLLSNIINSAILQFVVPDDYEIANISLTSTCGDECRIATNIITEEILTSSVMDNSELFLSFRPYTHAYHYLMLRLLSGNASNISIALSDNDSLSNNELTVNKIPLTRKSLPDFFLFDYEPLNGNSTKPTPINVTINSLTMLSFRVGAVYDVGGTVSIGLKLLNKTNDIVVVGCISLGIH